MNALNRLSRPSETTAALALLPTAYAAFVAIDLPKLPAAILAVLVAFVPWAVSTIKDGMREPDDPGDHDPEAGPATRSVKSRGESRGLRHDESGQISVTQLLLAVLIGVLVWWLLSLVLPAIVAIIVGVIVGLLVFRGGVTIQMSERHVSIGALAVTLVLLAVAAWLSRRPATPR